MLATLLRAALNKAYNGLGDRIGTVRDVWRESYTYDADGNLLSERGSEREATYTYNGQNRMATSAVSDYAANSRSSTSYGYDAYGRRTLTQDATSRAIRTLYDGFSFDTIQEGETAYTGGFSFTPVYIMPADQREAEAAEDINPNAVSGLRYQYVGDGSYREGNTRTVPLEADVKTLSRYAGTSMSLYANGEAVAVGYTTNGTTRGGVSYLGKDILGSVRATSDSNGVLEERYEYDAFGSPYKGDLTGGMNLGYTGKPYDAATGLYNYGYRDYAPSVARFTTVDPIRDGNNWFAYVNNDPVNYVDLWGLSASDKVGDIAGKVWASPWTVVGLGIGGALIGINTLVGNDGKVRSENNAITFTTELNLGGSITFGNVIIHAGGKDWNSSSPARRYDDTGEVNLGKHEEVHTYQYQKYGIFTPVLIVGSAILNGGLFSDGNLGKSSFEVAADDASQIR